MNLINSPAKNSDQEISELLEQIVKLPELHGKFLNTISLMEHTGAVLISKTQSSPDINFMVLKHAAEEARHAFYFKKLSQKISPGQNLSYSSEYLMAPTSSRQYLRRLNIAVSREVKQLARNTKELHWVSYLGVTYGIEKRAERLYLPYESALKNNKIEISLRSIIQEEEGHLAEMESELDKLDEKWSSIVSYILDKEQALFKDWLNHIYLEYHSYTQKNTNLSAAMI